MTVRQGPLSGLLIIEHDTVNDSRGFFRESVRMDEVEAAWGAPLSFVQWNHSRSVRGVLRGLHAENWEKLVYVSHGDVFTAIADIRPDSPTFGKIATFALGDSNRQMLLVPRGMGHGFCVLSDDADYTYLVTDYYRGAPTPSVAWDDPDLAIPWPVPNPAVSEKDSNNPTMRQLFPDLAALPRTS